MDDDAVSNHPHLIRRVAWATTTTTITTTTTNRLIQYKHQQHTKWRMVDTHLARKHFTNQPIVTIVPTYYGVSSDKDTSVKVYILCAVQMNSIQLNWVATNSPKLTLSSPSVSLWNVCHVHPPNSNHNHRHFLVVILITLYYSHTFFDICWPCHAFKLQMVRIYSQLFHSRSLLTERAKNNAEKRQFAT